MKRLVFDLTKILFLKRLIGIFRLIVEVLNDQNLFTESNLVNWFSSYVQFYPRGHFSERAETAQEYGKMNHLQAIHGVSVFQSIAINPVLSLTGYYKSLFLVPIWCAILQT